MGLDSIKPSYLNEFEDESSQGRGEKSGVDRVLLLKPEMGWASWERGKALYQGKGYFGGELKR